MMIFLTLRAKSSLVRGLSETHGDMVMSKEDMPYWGEWEGWVSNLKSNVV